MAESRAWLMRARTIKISLICSGMSMTLWCSDEVLLSQFQEQGFNIVSIIVDVVDEFAALDNSITARIDPNARAFAREVVIKTCLQILRRFSAVTENLVVHENRWQQIVLERRLALSIIATVNSKLRIETRIRGMILLANLVNFSTIVLHIVQNVNVGSLVESIATLYTATTTFDAHRREFINLLLAVSSTGNTSIQRSMLQMPELLDLIGNLLCHGQDEETAYVLTIIKNLCLNTETAATYIVSHRQGLLIDALLRKAKNERNSKIRDDSIRFLIQTVNSKTTRLLAKHEAFVDWLSEAAASAKNPQSGCCALRQNEAAVALCRFVDDVCPSSYSSASSFAVFTSALVQLLKCSHDDTRTLAANTLVYFSSIPKNQSPILRKQQHCHSKSSSSDIQTDILYELSTLVLQDTNNSSEYATQILYNLSRDPFNHDILSRHQELSEMLIIVLTRRISVDRHTYQNCIEIIYPIILNLDTSFQRNEIPKLSGRLGGDRKDDQRPFGTKPTMSTTLRCLANFCVLLPSLADFANSTTVSEMEKMATMKSGVKKSIVALSRAAILT